MISVPVKIELLKKGIICSQEAEKLGVSSAAVSMTLSGSTTSKRILNHFADKLGLSETELRRLIHAQKTQINEEEK